MLLPHTIFTGAVAPKYSFSSNQFLNSKSFQFRKLKRFAHRSQCLRPCPLLKAAGGRSSGWFRCRCSRCGSNLGAEGPAPGLRAQAVGGWVLTAAPRGLAGAGQPWPSTETAPRVWGLPGSACKSQASLSALCSLSWFRGLNGGQVFLNW